MSNYTVPDWRPFKKQESGVRRQEAGVRSQESGGRRQEELFKR
ncbi:hypothetical protein V0288_22150 [Pannus brasiliensis CCIBt3594]|uniref:Uncharacterized protein n=1 Tax=Pannus brasiliensis CCIBt3594 TaxID=1427578 RepID=A0AAW9QPY7_9CHRO